MESAGSNRWANNGMANLRMSDKCTGGREPVGDPDDGKRAVALLAPEPRHGLARPAAPATGQVPHLAGHHAPTRQTPC